MPGPDQKSLDAKKAAAEKTVLGAEAAPPHKETPAEKAARVKAEAQAAKDIAAAEKEKVKAAEDAEKARAAQAKLDAEAEQRRQVEARVRVQNEADRKAYEAAVQAKIDSTGWNSAVKNLETSVKYEEERINGKPASAGSARRPGFNEQIKQLEADRDALTNEHEVVGWTAYRRSVNRFNPFVESSDLDRRASAKAIHIIESHGYKNHGGTVRGVREAYLAMGDEVDSTKEAKRDAEVKLMTLKPELKEAQERQGASGAQIAERVRKEYSFEAWQADPAAKKPDRIILNPMSAGVAGAEPCDDKDGVKGDDVKKKSKIAAGSGGAKKKHHGGGHSSHKHEEGRDPVITPTDSRIAGGKAPVDPYDPKNADKGGAPQTPVSGTPAATTGATSDPRDAQIAAQAAQIAMLRERVSQLEKTVANEDKQIAELQKRLTEQQQRPSSPPPAYATGPAVSGGQPSVVREIIVVREPPQRIVIQQQAYCPPVYPERHPSRAYNTGYGHGYNRGYGNGYRDGYAHAHGGRDVYIDTRFSGGHGGGHDRSGGDYGGPHSPPPGYPRRGPAQHYG